MMMNQLLVVCAIAVLTLDAAYVPEPASKENESAQRNQQELASDIRSMYLERYSPGM
jgi:hypothetical protein